MGNLGTVISSFGDRGDAASSTGSLNAKIVQLLAYIESTSQLNGTTGVLVQYPVGTANGTNITGGNPAWTLGAWTEMVAASVLSSHVLVGFFCVTVNVNAWFQIDIGEGGAGAEVVKFRTSFMASASGPDGASTKWFFPGYRLTANARCAVRAATNNASNTFNLFLYFVPRPL